MLGIHILKKQEKVWTRTEALLIGLTDLVSSFLYTVSLGYVSTTWSTHLMDALLKVKTRIHIYKL